MRKRHYHKPFKDWLVIICMLAGLYFLLLPLANYNNFFEAKKTQEIPPPPSIPELFINEYKNVALHEMRRSGVPASITMAQAILETGYGGSDLAKTGKNFFGIKVGKFKKCKILYKGDYYRCYEHPIASFRDHSDFLVQKSLMKKLIKKRNRHYKTWTNTLTKIRYAEDPEYENKLNSIIERYDLYLLDKPKAQFACEIQKPI
jgi:flagellum-specific peptidoglycan hydrolase FlgJ